MDSGQSTHRLLPQPVKTLDSFCRKVCAKVGYNAQVFKKSSISSKDFRLRISALEHFEGFIPFWCSLFYYVFDQFS